MDSPNRAIAILGLAAVVTTVYARVVRPRHLRWGATDAEVTMTALGDELVRHPQLVATRAVTVRSPAEDIWPWLVQIGRGRAGWYSYDHLDNQGQPSALEILPEHQHMAIGETVAMSARNGEPFGPSVLALEPPHRMLWGDDAVPHRFTWLWLLEPDGEHRTRLITRLRYRFSWRDPITALLMEFIDPFMMRKAMLGIAERAEANPGSRLRRAS